MSGIISNRLPLFLLISLFVSPAFAGPKYGKNTTPLSEESGYLRGASKTDFWKLIPYYVPQHNDKACGVASTVIVLNALFAPGRNTSESKNVDVDELFKLNPFYKKAVGTNGKGIMLDQLGDALTKVFEKTTDATYTVTVERFDGKPSKSELKRFEKLLAANEKNPKNFIIANFLQGVLTGDRGGMVGHISPIGAYDARKKKVLILDTDRKYYQPYWVKVDKLFDAINTTDPASSKKRGLIVLTRE